MISPTRLAQWGFALAVSCWAAGAWARAGTAPWFEVTKSNGLVTRIKVHLAERNKVLILDRFTDIDAFVEDEKRAFSAPSRLDPVCRAIPRSQSCERTCYWASKARPFGRARLLTASGRVEWRWQAEGNEALHRLLSSSTRHTPDGACLSPDGRYLATASYLVGLDDDPSPKNSLAGYAVVDVLSRFKDAKVVGERSGEPFGHKRFTSFVAWRAGQPHTLVFEVTRPENDNRVVVDDGVAR